MVFLVIVLILFGFWRTLGQQLCKQTTLGKREDLQSAKSSIESTATLYMDLHGADSRSIRFAISECRAARKHQVVADREVLLAVKARALLYKLGSKKTVSDLSPSQSVRNQKLSKNTGSGMKNIGEAIEYDDTINCLSYDRGNARYKICRQPNHSIFLASACILCNSESPLSWVESLLK